MIQKKKCLEKPVQEMVNKYLKLKNIFYIRIPDSLYRTLKWLYLKKKIKPHIYKHIMSQLKGLPDNIAIVPLTDTICLACPIECKSSVGKLTIEQKEYSNLINYQVPRSPEEAVMIIEKFIKEGEKIKKILKKGSV